MMPVKNPTSSVKNVRLVCGRRFPLQLGVVLVYFFSVLELSNYQISHWGRGIFNLRTESDGSNIFTFGPMDYDNT